MVYEHIPHSRNLLPFNFRMQLLEFFRQVFYSFPDDLEAANKTAPEVFIIDKSFIIKQFRLPDKIPCFLDDMRQIRLMTLQ